MNEDVYVTVIYAKCSAKERKDLWESLENISSDVSGPWCIGGDFNVIMDQEESWVVDLTEPTKALISSLQWKLVVLLMQDMWELDTLGVIIEGQEREYEKGSIGCQSTINGLRSFNIIMLGTQ